MVPVSTPYDISPADAAGMLAANLDRVYRAADHVARRNALTPEEAEDFRGWVLDHLTANEYGVLRRFRGESSLPTYLTVVVASQLRDFRVARHGRWRPSAEARRLGPPAPRLERLVLRQGCGLAEAAEILRSSGETSMTDAELARMLARLPARGPMRPSLLGPGSIETLPATDGAPFEESEAERRRVYACLEAALHTLDAGDRLVLRMHFWEGATIQAVARTLGVDAKGLYRRMDRLRGRLRSHLEAAGVTGADALSLLGRD